MTVATYNRCSLLKRALEALADQTLDRGAYEIIVCDSRSSDGTDVMMAKYAKAHPDLTVRHLHTKNILAAKRNAGIAAAKNEIVIFLDDDCIAEKDFLKKYHMLFNRKDDGLSHVVYCGEVRFPDEWASRSNYYRYRDAEGFSVDDIKSKKTLDFRTIVVMNMAFLKSSFMQFIGGVNERFVGYGMEDQDLGWRIQRAGFEMRMCDARVYHHEPSGNILGYRKKIFHTARDGVTTLLRVNMDAAKAIHTLRVVDKDYPHGSVVRAAFWACVRRIAFHNWLANSLARFLIATDRYPHLYVPLLYKYVLACGYIAGAHARSRREPRSTADWYS